MAESFSNQGAGDENRLDMDPNEGLVFLIQSYSIQDGPGMRTTVFMKGCPLRCVWCHNPESWNSAPELMTHNGNCIACGKCAEVCPESAIIFNQETGRRVKREACSLCFKCAAVCPAGALTKVGQYMSVEEVVKEIEKDELFFRRSDGGMTVSGGEPLLQGRYVKRLLKECRERGLHTALDTCGYSPWETFEEVLNFTDLVLFDIKHLEPEAHITATGVSNMLPLENLLKIPKDKRVWLRIPLIPDFNDSPDHINKICKLAQETGVEKISILPFNRLGDGKYGSLDWEEPVPETVPPPEERLREIRKQIEDLGIQVSLGE